jgi:L-fuculose-phosphate aldolase
MKTVISLRDVEDLLRKGGSVDSLPADAIYTPSALELMRDAKSAPASKSGVPAKTNSGAPAKTSSIPRASAAAEEINRYFNSPEVNVLKELICGVGHRLWQRSYVDGNGGNISIRLSDELVLCTPTMVSKGALKPSDLCLVDMDGRQLAGTKPRTSEVMMHLQIMKAQPKARACVHAHPPHATAFAVAGIEPPTCMMPEYEVFCAVAVAPYRTPGTDEMGKLVAELADKHNTILMANHGVVAWSHNSVEEAYWRMEIIEAYCRTIVVATQLGKPISSFGTKHMQDLLNIKKKLGFVDPRFELKECELCDNSEFRPGVSCQVPAEKPVAAESSPEAEQLVKTITDMLMAKLKG